MHLTTFCSFLFWTRDGPHQGIFRLDLAELPDDGDATRASDSRPPSPRHIIQTNILSTLAVDYMNYQLFYPNETNNTMMSANLDGSDIAGKYACTFEVTYQTEVLLHTRNVRVKMSLKYHTGAYSLMALVFLCRHQTRRAHQL